MSPIFLSRKLQDHGAEELLKREYGESRDSVRRDISFILDVYRMLLKSFRFDGHTRRGSRKSLDDLNILASTGELLEATPEDMYNVSILFDMDALPEDFEPLVKKVGDFRKLLSS